MKYDRRQFMGAATLTFAATLAETKGKTVVSNLPANNSFGPVKQIDAGLLNLGFVEAVQPMVIAGASALPKESDSTMISKGGLLGFP